MRIAFTHNLKRSDSEEEAEFDTPATVAWITETLQKLGHEVEPIEVSGIVTRVVAKLESLQPDLVFNTAEGRHGRYREAFYPGLFEQLGLAYTGSDAYVCALTLDKQQTKLAVAARGIQTPQWIFVDRTTPRDRLTRLELKYPLMVKPNFEGSSKGITQDAVVQDLQALEKRVAMLLETYPDGVLIEEYIEGRDLVVPFIEHIGRDKTGVMPAAEYAFDPNYTAKNKFTFYSYELKNQFSDYVSVKVPADLSKVIEKKVIETSQKIYRVLGVRDLGRIDFRLTEAGELYFIEINALPSLEQGASIYESARLMGLENVHQVLGAVIDSACKRQQQALKGKGRSSRGTSLRVGFTYNQKRIVPTLAGQDDKEAEYDSPTTLDAIRTAIKSLGHEVIDLEATADLPTTAAAAHVDVVFNIAEGAHGRNREAVVPAILELLGIAYTGSDPTALALTLDKALAKRIVQHAGIRTPTFMLMQTGKEKLVPGLAFPLFVKPLYEGSSKGVQKKSVVHSEAKLRDLVPAIAGKYRQPALIENYLPGREFTIGILGERKPRVLPPMEIVFLDKSQSHPAYTFEHKQEASSQIRYDVPAQVTPELGKELERVAKACFVALGCRDVARVDVRLDAEGNVNFVECNPLPGLTPGWSDLCLIAEKAGLSYPALIQEILSPAIRRHKTLMRAKTAA